MDKKIGVCYKCRNMYNNAINEFFCPNCEPEMTEKIEAINKYTEAHTDVTIEEIAQEFEMEQELVKKLQSKRIIKIHCKMCGEIIQAGVLCDKCKAKAIVKLSSIKYEKQPLPEVKAKMHFVNSDKKHGRLSGE
ncbi:MAG: hypothetical protein K5883_07695 [Pseudobutyrivibrio sp.]|nr:hypothetical protein [Pseudobutyrivibrio sp.]